MSRSLGGLSTEVAEDTLNPFMAVYIGIADPVIAWTGIGTLSFGGRVWEGVGATGSLDAIGEQSDGTAVGYRAALSGIPAEFRTDIAAQASRGAVFEVWVGAVSENFKTLVAAKMMWRGKVDQYNISDTGTEISVEIVGESSNRDQGRPRIKRYTDAEQQARYSGDKFFEFLPSMAEVKILWARGSGA